MKQLYGPNLKGNWVIFYMRCDMANKSDLNSLFKQAYEDRLGPLTGIHNILRAPRKRIYYGKMGQFIKQVVEKNEKE